MTTKQYLRFTPSSVFGVIASSTAKILHLDYNKKCNTVAVPACENVIIWNVQTKEKSLVLHGDSSYVTCLICDGNFKNIAVGYANGFIGIYDFKTGRSVVSFCGHKSAVSCLAYDDENLNLASGGKDSEIVIWNISDEAGLCRFKGHKGPVTRCHFIKQQNILISSSKDTFIKFWDLNTKHCFQTIVGNRNEILDFIVIKDSRLITAVNDAGLRVWDVYAKNQVTKEENENIKKPRIDESGEIGIEEEVVDGDDEILKYVQTGTIKTVENKTVELIVDKTERLLGCHASSKLLQLYKILNAEEIAKKVKKRKKNLDKIRDATMCDVTGVAIPLADEFQSLQLIQTNGKIDSFSMTILKEEIVKITVLLKNNSIYQYQLDFSVKGNTAELCHSVVLPGHRSIIRSLNYSSDSLSILSVSDESVKLWKRFREEQVCTQTLTCDSGLCSVFVTGNSYCVIGTKNGTLMIYDINSQELLEVIESHDGPVNCLCESPDQRGVTSGSKDKSIKFWDFELVQDENFSKTKKKLTLSLKRTLQMPEEVICLKYSPDKTKIAASLLDNTVQVLFVDSLKLVFSLYGHVLPVTCMDISYDGTLIATGSEDKDIRIWSMEFGSCNKFIKKAHDKGITSLYFLPKTHMFFTGGRDNAVKQWDADNFQKIISLKGHQNEITAMAVSPDGVTVVTASRDKSMRIWEKTQEPLILQEEQEKELEEGIEAEDLPVVPGDVNHDIALPGIKTVETIKSVEQLLEAIDIYKEETEKLKEHEQECKRLDKELPLPAPHPLLIAYSATSPIRYMQKVLNKIKSSELEGTLIFLPFNYVLDFLKIICELVERGWDIELCERCTSFLIKIHMGQILSSQNFQPVLEKLQEKLFSQVHKTRDMVKFVRSSCLLLQKAIDSVEEVPMFTSILDGLQQKKKKSKKKLERPIMTFNS